MQKNPDPPHSRLSLSCPHCQPVPHSKGKQRSHSTHLFVPFPTSIYLQSRIHCWICPTLRIFLLCYLLCPTDGSLPEHQPVLRSLSPWSCSVSSHSSPISAAGVDAELIQAPILDLLQEGECTQLLHHMQPPCLVVVQDVVKSLRAPVKEILILHQVSIITELKEARGHVPGSRDHHSQFAETSVRVARQSLLGHHKAAASHIDRKAVQRRNNLLQQGPLLLLAGENTAVQGTQRRAIPLFLQGRLGIKRHAAGRRLHPVAASSSPHSPGWKTQQSCRDVLGGDSGASLEMRHFLMLWLLSPEHLTIPTSSK